MIIRLYQALRGYSAPDLDLTDLGVEELLDALWLARRMDGGEGATGRAGAPAVEPHGEDQPHPTPPAADLPPPEPTGQRPAGQQPVGLRQPKRQHPREQAQVEELFAARAPLALPQQLELGRALRPLSRRVAGATPGEVDEAATVHQIAEERIWRLITRPRLERWLDLVLLVDQSESMVLWRQTIAELQALLSWQGAFRDVRVLGLCTDSTPPWIRPFIALPQTNYPGARSAQEFATPRGRRLVLVATDGVAEAWGGSALADLLAAVGPGATVAIVELLPERLWRRSGLGALPQALVHASRPLTANRRLDWERRDWRRVSPGAIPVAVSELSGAGLAGLAALVTGAPNSQLPAVLADRRAAGAAPITEVLAAGEAEDVVQSFEAFASPGAYELARRLSLVPVTLPIMRLVATTVALGPHAPEVAEVFLSGLLELASRDDHPDSAIYEFVAGARLTLRRSMSSAEMQEVLWEVGRLIPGLGGLHKDFWALIDSLPHLGDDVDPLTRTFALLTAEALWEMGGRWATERAAQINPELRSREPIAAALLGGTPASRGVQDGRPVATLLLADLLDEPLPAGALLTDLLSEPLPNSSPAPETAEPDQEPVAPATAPLVEEPGVSPPIRLAIDFKQITPPTGVGSGPARELLQLLQELQGEFELQAAMLEQITARGLRYSRELAAPYSLDAGRLHAALENAEATHALVAESVSRKFADVAGWSQGLGIMARLAEAVRPGRLNEAVTLHDSLQDSAAQLREAKDALARLEQIPLQVAQILATLQEQITRAVRIAEELSQRGLEGDPLRLRYRSVLHNQRALNRLMASLWLRDEVALQSAPPEAVIATQSQITRLQDSNERDLMVLVRWQNLATAAATKLMRGSARTYVARRQLARLPAAVEKASLAAELDAGEMERGALEQRRVGLDVQDLPAYAEACAQLDGRLQALANQAQTATDSITYLQTTAPQITQILAESDTTMAELAAADRFPVVWDETRHEQARVAAAYATFPRLDTPRTIGDLAGQADTLRWIQAGCTAVADTIQELSAARQQIIAQLGDQRLRGRDQRWIERLRELRADAELFDRRNFPEWLDVRDLEDAGRRLIGRVAEVRYEEREPLGENELRERNEELQVVLNTLAELDRREVGLDRLLRELHTQVEATRALLRQTLAPLEGLDLHAIKAPSGSPLQLAANRLSRKRDAGTARLRRVAGRRPQGIIADEARAAQKWVEESQAECANLEQQLSAACAETVKIIEECQKGISSYAAFASDGNLLVIRQRLDDLVTRNGRTRGGGLDVLARSIKQLIGVQAGLLSIQNDLQQIAAQLQQLQVERQAARSAAEGALSRLEASTAERWPPTRYNRAEIARQLNEIKHSAAGLASSRTRADYQQLSQQIVRSYQNCAAFVAAEQQKVNAQKHAVTRIEGLIVAWQSQLEARLLENPDLPEAARSAAQARIAEILARLERLRQDIPFRTRDPDQAARQIADIWDRARREIKISSRPRNIVFRTSAVRDEVQVTLT